MKKVTILLSLVVFFAVSCAKNDPETRSPDVNATPCKQEVLKSSELPSSVDVEFTDKGVQIKYYNFEVTCDFTTVNVTHTLVNGVLNITQKGSPNQVDCVCHSDVSYTIEGISKKEVNVIIINGKQVYCHNNPLKGTKWKAIGFMDTQTGDLREFEPKGDKEGIGMYTLSFDLDEAFLKGNNLWGQGCLNYLVGNYEIDYAMNSIYISIRIASYAGQHPDEILFIETLNKVYSFSLQEEKLLLYFDEHKYLIFIPIFE